MLLYWAMFTIGYFAGAILSFKIFAAKKPEEEEEPTTFVLINNQMKTLEEKTPALPNTAVITQTTKES